MTIYSDIQETIRMLDKEKLDIRTITMGISLLDCFTDDINITVKKIYDKIYAYSSKLVDTGEDIAKEYGIPIINKRIAVTPIALAAFSKAEDYIKIASTLDKCANDVGVNFIGGYSALVHKDITKSEHAFLDSIPKALKVTKRVCSSVNVGSTKAGINLDAIKLIGSTIKQIAFETKDEDSIGCAKFVVFANAVEDNPFMAGAFHGVGAVSYTHLLQIFRQAVFLS